MEQLIVTETGGRQLYFVRSQIAGLCPLPDERCCVVLLVGGGQCQVNAPIDNVRDQIWPPAPSA